jgi:hypothetical protein
MEIRVIEIKVIEIEGTDIKDINKIPGIRGIGITMHPGNRISDRTF